MCVCVCVCFVAFGSACWPLQVEAKKAVLAMMCVKGLKANDFAIGGQIVLVKSSEMKQLFGIQKDILSRGSKRLHTRIAAELSEIDGTFKDYAGFACTAAGRLLNIGMTDINKGLVKNMSNPSKDLLAP